MPTNRQDVNVSNNLNNEIGRDSSFGLLTFFYSDENLHFFRIQIFIYTILQKNFCNKLDDTWFHVFVRNEVWKNGIFSLYFDKLFTFGFGTKFWLACPSTEVWPRVPSYPGHLNIFASQSFFPAFGADDPWTPSSLFSVSYFGLNSENSKDLLGHPLYHLKREEKFIQV